MIIYVHSHCATVCMCASRHAFRHSRHSQTSLDGRVRRQSAVVIEMTTEAMSRRRKAVTVAKGSARLLPDLCQTFAVNTYARLMPDLCNMCNNVYVYVDRCLHIHVYIYICDVMSCNVMSCNVMSCNVMLCDVM